MNGYLTGLDHHTFDPLLGYTKDEGELPGIQVWPKQRRWNEANIRIFCLGGSTTMWPPDTPYPGCELLGEWSRFLGELLEQEGHKPLIFNGAACGYCSDQDLLKLLRDGPGLKPHWVISMSGVNDLGFVHSAEPYPLTHRYQAFLAEQITKGSSGDLVRFNLGIPWKCEPYERWLRNARLLHLVAADLGARSIICLQPLLGIGASTPTTDLETRFLAVCKDRPCRKTSYLEEAERFYSEVRKTVMSAPQIYSHVIDFTDIFSGQTKVWADHRHPNPKGNRLLATQVLEGLKAQGMQR